MWFHRRALGLLLVAAAVSGCSDDPAPENASPTTTAAAAEASVATSTTTVTAAPAPNQRPAVAAETLATLDGRLLVVNAEGQVELLDPTGTTRITLDSADDALLSQPAWAPAGDRVSWTAITAAGPAVRIHDLATEATTDIPTSTPAFYHSWNATGDELATLRSAGGPIQLDVHRASTGTTQEVALGQPFYLDWADAGVEAVLAVNGSSVARVDLAEGTGTDLQLPAPIGVFQSPSVLADGSFLIPLAAANGFELVQVAPDDTLRRIARFDGAIAMATSPDSMRVAVLVGRDPSQPRLEQASFQTLAELPSGLVSIVDLDAGTVDTLPHRDVVALNWSPDGEVLATLQIDPIGARWLYTRGGTTTTGPDHTPTATMRDQYLPFADQYNQSHRWWSPDSRAFVFAGSIAGVPGVWVDVVDDDAEPAKIADGSIAFWSPS